MAKVKVIQEHVDKYSVSARCRVLKISGSSDYDSANEQENEEKRKEEISCIFKESRKTDGTRKITREPAKQDPIISRRKRGRLTKELGFVSVDTMAKCKAPRAKCKEERILRKKGWPSDNAMAEAVFKVLKTAFIPHLLI